ncbi:MAG: ricin-type beta-trefoil lectin domain protein [Acidobacteriota bacterium]
MIVLLAGVSSAAHAYWDDLWINSWNMDKGGNDKWRFVKKNLVNMPSDVVLLQEAGELPTSGIDLNNILNIWFVGGDATDPTTTALRFTNPTAFRNGRSWQQLVQDQNQPLIYTAPDGTRVTTPTYNAIYEFEWDCGDRDVDPITGARRRHYIYYFPTHGTQGYAHNRGQNMAIVTNTRANWVGILNRRMTSANPNTGPFVNRGVPGIQLSVRDALQARGESPVDQGADLHWYWNIHAGSGQSNTRNNNADRILTALGTRTANQPAGQETFAAGDPNRDGLNDDPAYMSISNRYTGVNVVPRDNNDNNRFADYRPNGPTRLGRDGQVQRMTQLDMGFATGGRMPSFGARLGPPTQLSDHQPVSFCRNYGLKRTRISPKGSVNTTAKRQCTTSKSKSSSGEPQEGAVVGEVCNRSDNQEWSFEPDGSLKLGTLCLRHRGDGYKPWLTTCDPTAANQKWQIRHGRTSTLIKNAESERCLLNEGLETGAHSGELRAVACDWNAKYQDFLLGAGEGQILDRDFNCIGISGTDAVAKTCDDFPFSTVSWGGVVDQVWRHGLDGSIQRYGSCLEANSSDIASVQPCEDGNLDQKWIKIAGGEGLLSIGRTLHSISDDADKFKCLDKYNGYTLWSCFRTDEDVASGNLRFGDEQRFYMGQEFGRLESNTSGQCLEEGNFNDLDYAACAESTRQSFQLNWNGTLMNGQECAETNAQNEDIALASCSYTSAFQQWNNTYKGVLINEEAEVWITGPNGGASFTWE